MLARVGARPGGHNSIGVLDRPRDTIDEAMDASIVRLNSYSLMGTGGSLACRLYMSRDPCTCQHSTLCLRDVLKFRQRDDVTPC
jgi:hypothetical protein